MAKQEVQLAHNIRETCRRIRENSPALKRDVFELIEKIDMFLECIAGNSMDAGLPIS